MVWEVSSLSCVIKGDKTGFFQLTGLRGQCSVSPCADPSVLKRDENSLNTDAGVGERVRQCKLKIINL